MGHFAELDENNIVLRVIVAEQDFIDSGAVGDPSRWRRTSYNTHGGKHRLGGTPLRMNYAGAGYRYDAARDAFIPPQTFPSWVLNQTTCLWEAPIPMPADCQFCGWNEETRQWVDATDPAQQDAIKLANEALDDSE